MAIYSQPTPAELDQITAKYGLGAIRKLHPFTQGQENSNFHLVTTAGEYVLTICENKSLVEVERLVNTLTHLANHNFYTTRIVRTLEGATHTSWHGKPVLLKTYLAGVVHNPLHPGEHEPLGRALGRLHQVPPPDFLPTTLNYGWQTFRPMRAAFAKDHPFLGWLEDFADYLQPFLTEDLPRALVHGDVFADNVVIDPVRGPLIMDFEEATVYYRLFDVGMTIVGACRTDGQFNREAQAGLVRGYREVISLTHAEERALPAFVNYAAAAMASWRFWQFNVVQPEAGKQEHYRELQALVKY